MDFILIGWVLLGVVAFMLLCFVLSVLLGVTLFPIERELRLMREAYEKRNKMIEGQFAESRRVQDKIEASQRAIPTATVLAYEREQERQKRAHEEANRIQRAAAQDLENQLRHPR